MKIKTDIMLRILYWNIKRKGDKLLDAIVKLSENTDILIIAELSLSNNKLKINGTSIEQIITNISLATGFEYLGRNNDSWIHLWLRKGLDAKIVLVNTYDKLRKPKDIVDKECSDSEYFAEYLNRYERMQFYKISYRKIEFLLVPIHFPSRLYASIGKQKDISVLFRKYIEIVESENHLKSIIVGDFNMNPFEPGMIHHEGFHALPFQSIEDSIEFYDVPFRTFYNPTWGKYGDYELIENKVKKKPAGSYYDETSSDINYYWYVFDQVIMRKDLITQFSFENFKYLTSINTENDLLNDDFSPNENEYSDHLPVKFHVNN